jgi:hypothetical protein
VRGGREKKRKKDERLCGIRKGVVIAKGWGEPGEQRGQNEVGGYVSLGKARTWSKKASTNGWTGVGIEEGVDTGNAGGGEARSLGDWHWSLAGTMGLGRVEETGGLRLAMAGAKKQSCPLQSVH